MDVEEDIEVPHYSEKRRYNPNYVPVIETNRSGKQFVAFRRRSDYCLYEGAWRPKWQFTIHGVSDDQSPCLNVLQEDLSLGPMPDVSARIALTDKLMAQGYRRYEADGIVRKFQSSLPPVLAQLTTELHSKVIMTFESMFRFVESLGFDDGDFAYFVVCSIQNSVVKTVNGYTLNSLALSEIGGALYDASDFR